MFIGLRINQCTKSSTATLQKNLPPLTCDNSSIFSFSSFFSSICSILPLNLFPSPLPFSPFKKLIIFSSKPQMIYFLSLTMIYDFDYYEYTKFIKNLHEKIHRSTPISSICFPCYCLVFSNFSVISFSD